MVILAVESTSITYLTLWRIYYVLPWSDVCCRTEHFDARHCWAERG